MRNGSIKETRNMEVNREITIGSKSNGVVKCGHVRRMSDDDGVKQIYGAGRSGEEREGGAEIDGWSSRQAEEEGGESRGGELSAGVAGRPRAGKALGGEWQGWLRVRSRGLRHISLEI